MNQSGLVNVSFDKTVLSAFKRGVLREKPYYDRVSIALAIRLGNAASENIDVFAVIDEIDYLEGINTASRTKDATQFRKPPLQGLWHKHFFSARHLIKNVGIRWNLAGGGNKNLSEMIESVAREHGDNPDLWPNVLTHRLVVEGFDERADRGLTGDWIIYGIHQGQNFYLDLATHEEGLQPERLLQKLRNGCYAEFPFIFE